MNVPPPSPEHDTGSILSILSKLPPWIIAIGLLALAGILAEAVWKGQKVTLWKLIIEPAEQNKNSIPFSDLHNLSPKYFTKEQDKEKYMEAIRQSIGKNEEIQNMEQVIYYKIAMAELMIPKYGNSIDTNNKNKNMVEAYKKIQNALVAINFYEGDIDGDQDKTNRAVKNFQTNYNVKFKKDIIPKDELGYFGFYTCFAIGKWSRKQGGETQASNE